MRRRVYNSAILKMKLATCAFPIARNVARHARATSCAAFFLIFFSLVSALNSTTANWSEPEQELAHKIVAITGPGAVALTVNNRSSLDKKENDIIGNGLRFALEALGIRFMAADQATATVAITLSENQTSYVWVAEVHQGAGESAVAMVSTPRAEGLSVVRESVPLLLTKTSLLIQPDRILDVTVLEENAPPPYIAVLDAERVTFYRWRGEKWDQEQALAITHVRPWPRDLRGRLVLARDHLLDVYLPGVLCRTASGVPLTLNCRESDDPWPLVPPALAVSGSNMGFSSGLNKAALFLPLNAFFAPTRNFFTGVISPRVGNFTTVPKFYSLAFVPRDKYVLWLFATTDGSIHMIDGVSDLALKLAPDKAGWGSDLATVHTSCGAGWQVLAATHDDANHQDSIRAYEFPDRDPVAVSSAVNFQGEVTALWTGPKGDSAIAVFRDRETGEYEAFRLSLSCGQ
jgi:hypothetical protein